MNEGGGAKGGEYGIFEMRLRAGLLLDELFNDRQVYVLLPCVINNLR